MFLKEALATLAFGTSTLGISGFAIKVDKFEHNYLIANKLVMPVESYRKLNLRKGDNFYYFEGDKVQSAKIIDVQAVSKEMEQIQLSLEPKWFQRRNYQTSTNPTKVIKYRLETKPFWVNLFT